jgi:hypothetical protein
MRRFLEWRWLLAGLSAASVVRELRKPPAERTWHDRLFGVVPYDWRLPTPARIKAAFWSPDDPRLFTDRPFGVGWAINVHRLASLLSAARRSAPRRPTVAAPT